MIHPHDPDEPPMAAKYAAFNRYRPRTEVSTTQYAADWNEPDAAIRPATTDPARGYTAVMTDAIVESRIHGRSPWATVEAIGDALDRAGYTVAMMPIRPDGSTAAARASEAVRGDGSPTPDVGAMRGGEGGSAAESEPRGIVGPGYDAVWTYIRTHPGDAYRNAAIWRAVEAFRDAVIPAIRAQVADEIACDICEPMDDCDRPSCPDCIRHEYAQRLARRIRGDQ